LTSGRLKLVVFDRETTGDTCLTSFIFLASDRLLCRDALCDDDDDDEL
jgi:hypothetical protein